MSIHITLIDKSEIVYKMLSHCLHYFPVKILRFDNLSASQSHFASHKQPADIAFVDWDVKKGGKAAIYSAIEEMKPTPVVLLYRTDLDISADSGSIAYKIKKPLDPKTVRNMLIKLVPQIEESPIYSFLKFPKSPGEKEGLSAPLDHKPANIPIKEGPALESKSLQNLKILDQAKTGAQTLFKPTFSKILTLKDKTQDQKKSPRLNPFISTGKPDPKRGLAEGAVSTGKPDPKRGLAEGAVSAGKPDPKRGLAEGAVSAGQPDPKRGLAEGAVSAGKPDPKREGAVFAGKSDLKRGLAEGAVFTGKPDPKWEGAVFAGKPDLKREGVVSTGKSDPKRGLAEGAVSAGKSDPKREGAVSNRLSDTIKSGLNKDSASMSLPAGDQSHSKSQKTSVVSPDLKSSPPLAQKDKTFKGSVFKNKMNKENINIDENTKNDLAPMAIKSPASQPERSVKAPWSEQDILRVLQKYKDSLEFQKLMEKALSGYAQQTVAGILQNGQAPDILRESLIEFKESQKFKNLVELKAVQYIQKHLPSIMKSLVEREIKKIIGD